MFPRKGFLMIELSNSVAQTLLPGQSVTFDVTKVRTGCCELHRQGSGLVQLRQRGVYEASFGANVTNAVAGPVQLSLQLDGEQLLESTAVSTPSAVGDINSVSRSGILIDSRCGCCGTVTLTNTGSQNIVVTAGAVLTIQRVA